MDGYGENSKQVSSLGLLNRWCFISPLRAFFFIVNFLGCVLEAFSEQVVGKNKEGEEEVRSAALEGVLMEAHALFTMFYGSIRALLQKHPAGDAARSCLHAFLPDYLAGIVLRRSETFLGMSQDIVGVFSKC